jgi:hypothetical protein
MLYILVSRGKMVLENIVKFVKVASTNRLIPATYLLSSTASVLTLVDGRINSMDTASLLLAGTAVTIGTASAVIEQMTYRDVERMCENYGFSKELMREKIFRRKAKIYSDYSGRIDEFKLALKQDQV